LFALSRYFNGLMQIDLIINLTTQYNLNSVLNRFKMVRPNPDNFDFAEFGNGGHIQIRSDSFGFPVAKTPDCCNTHEDEVVFCRNETPQNDFCYIYLALYMLGNFCRYYPDLWLKAVEQNYPIATSAERFIELIESKMPLCTLSEMSRTYYVPKS
ncbi:YaaC family protein, partial [Methylobacterium iners]|uniref:YaaC family protein n=1 Tax=Methylobacterium iners TaxID=418707 RepID=UPI001EE1B783